MKPKSNTVRPVRLKPIGEGSDAARFGYGFDFVMDWLENIRDSEMEAYKDRAHKLSDLVNELRGL